MAGFDDLVIASGGQAYFYEDITTIAGASIELPWTLLDAAGNAVDVSGATARCEIRSKPGGTLLFTFATSGGTGTITHTSGGDFRIKATPAQTAGLATDEPVNGVYDIKVTSATGRVLLLSTGRWTFQPEVTTT